MKKDELTVAVVHYHARPGGVTSVMRDSLLALKEAGLPIRLLRVIGEAPPEESISFPTVVIPGLSYPEAMDQDDLQDWAAGAFNAVKETLGGREPDIWHFHNHALGKNKSMLYWVNWLHQIDQNLLLQIHDFAEDHRIANFHYREQHRPPALPVYPVGQNIRYAVLNQRDKKILIAAGCGAEQVTCLPNPIRTPKDPASIQPTEENKEGWILYPVRALPRKNLGEILLLAAHGPASQRWITSLGPSRPEHRPMVDHWQSLARRFELPVELGVVTAGKITFKDAYSGAKSIVSTSIQEGFGLGFLEPWLNGKPCTGRDLPAITEDFKKAGIQFPNTYSSLPIPPEWMPVKSVEDHIQRTADSCANGYGILSLERWRELLLDELRPGGSVDFGRLPFQIQSELVENVLKNGWRLSYLEEWDPQQYNDQRELLIRNANLIASHFGFAAYARKLEDTYQSFSSHSTGNPAQSIDIGKLIILFHQPQHP